MTYPTGWLNLPLMGCARPTAIRTGFQEDAMNYTSLTKCMNPDGWFQVGYSDELEKGQVKPLK